MALWRSFYTDVYPSITGKVNEKVYELYSEFIEGRCNAVIACESTDDRIQANEIEYYKIPAGRYARFLVHGEVHKVIPGFWENVDCLNLERTYLCDFEEYPNSATEDADVAIYIGVR